MQIYINDTNCPHLEGEKGEGYEANPSCISCHREFAPDSGKYWTPNGYLCVDCYDAQGRSRLHAEFYGLLSGNPGDMRGRE